jgi:GTPase Era involved in 16S rRNA processing
MTVTQSEESPFTVHILLIDKWNQMGNNREYVRIHILVPNRNLKAIFIGEGDKRLPEGRPAIATNHAFRLA